MEPDSEIGIIGLGKIGGNLAKQADEKDIQVVGLDTVDKPELRDEGVVVVNGYDEFIAELTQPRVIYLSIPAGPTVDDIIGDLRPRLDAGDVLMDGEIPSLGIRCAGQRTSRRIASISLMLGPAVASPGRETARVS